MRNTFNLFEQSQPQYLSMRDTTLAYSQNPNTTSNHDTSPKPQHAKCMVY